MFGWEEKEARESSNDMILLLHLKTDVSFNQTRIVTKKRKSCLEITIFSLKKKVSLGNENILKKSLLCSQADQFKFSLYLKWNLFA